MQSMLGTLHNTTPTSSINPGWRNWQRARLLIGRLRVRVSLWEFLFLSQLCIYNTPPRQHINIYTLTYNIFR